MTEIGSKAKSVHSHCVKTARWLAVAGTLGAASCVSAPTTVLERLSEARRLTAEALVQFTKAADAANRAVMASTDEGVAEFGREADRSNNLVQSTVDELRPLLAGLGYSKESQLLGEFDGRFKEYRALDRQILEMVVESSNLKAQRLSFGSVQEQADALRDALEAVRRSARAGDRWQVEGLAATALSTVREIQALQAPHIAEPNDEPMTRIEKRMSDAESSARRALAGLAAVVPAAEKPKVETASAAFDRFMNLNAQILTLSRRNSNVQALALSLGQKRTLVAACEDSLRALQAELTRRGFTGTR